MQFDEGIPEPPNTRKRRWDFKGVKPGYSTHVKTDDERCRVMSAFRYHVENDPRMRVDAYATSAAVGKEDPRGPGFRVFFRSRKLDGVELDPPPVSQSEDI